MVYISHNCSRVAFLLLLAITIFVSGCGEFFDKKQTEIQAREILSELDQVKQIPQTNNPLPELYRGPAKRLKVKTGVKVFYYARNNSVDQLVKLLNEQFSLMQTDAKGVTTYAPHYAVSLHQATNQIVIDAPND